MTTVLINNRWVDPEEAKISVFSPGLTHGRGIFETLRTYPGKKFFQLDAHLRRLIGSAKKIGLDRLYSFNEIKDMVMKAADSSEHELQRLKILLIPENLIVISWPLSPEDEAREGASLKSVIMKRSLPEIKSVAYLDCLLAYERARKAGYSEALLIDGDGYVYEGSRSSVLWIDNGVLCAREKDVLPGIAREFILKNSPLARDFKNIKYDELIGKKEVFITNSVMGITPVTRIDRNSINKGRVGPTLRLLMEWFRSEPARRRSGITSKTEREARDG